MVEADLDSSSEEVIPLIGFDVEIDVEVFTCIGFRIDRIQIYIVALDGGHLDILTDNLVVRCSVFSAYIK